MPAYTSQMNARYTRFGGALLASAYSLNYAFTYRDWHFIDNADLIFHEAGHTLFIFFGQFIYVLMGSGFQILLPAFIAGYFFHTRQKLSGAICIMWTGINILNVSVYAGDSIAMQLPLLGGDTSGHDWHYLLSTLGILSWTPMVATVLYAAGMLTIAAGIVLSAAFAWLPGVQLE
jgi:hypothetical protein